MSFIKVEKFARFGDNGELRTLYCKLCGVVIGENQQRTIGFRTLPNGQKVERVLEGFLRNHLYMEIKIVFDDGSAHVTNGCKNCLTGDLGGEILAQLTSTDELEQKLKASNRKPLGIVEAVLGGGIV
jgi:hypothetical protein